MKEYTGKDILNIDNPCLLFAKDEETAKGQYRELAKQFHPDKSIEGNAGEIFAHIVDLFENQILLEKITCGKFPVYSN